MKNIFYLIILYIFTINLVLCQEKSIISGSIQTPQDSTITINLRISADANKGEKDQEYTIKTKNGSFNFDFVIKKTSTAILYLNNNLAFLPGAFSVVINPGDSINFNVPTIKDVGLVNMEISGRGSEKLRFMQKIMRNIVSTGLSKKPWNKMSITEKYLKTDRYLSIIDSMFKNTKIVNSTDFQLIRSQLVDQSLDMLLYHSVQHYSDSVKMLFDKYIVSKNRILPLLNARTINYFGGNHVLPDYMYLRNMNVIKGRLEKFRFKYPMEYSSFVVKEFRGFSAVKDYLLSTFALDFFSEKWDSSESHNLYKYYLANADKKNSYYQSVTDAFIHVNNNLKVGKSFYNFQLPDTLGNIHRLEDYRGKVIILDFWFTGCSGCKFLTPYLDKAEKSFENDPVQFISINVDSKSTWKLGIGEYSSRNAVQLYTEEQRFDHPLVKFSKINAYPRLIIVDRHGNIAGIPPDPRNDLEGFKAYVKNLLN